MKFTRMLISAIFIRVQWGKNDFVERLTACHFFSLIMKIMLRAWFVWIPLLVVIGIELYWTVFKEMNKIFF